MNIQADFLDESLSKERKLSSWYEYFFWDPDSISFEEFKNMDHMELTRISYYISKYIKTLFKWYELSYLWHYINNTANILVGKKYFVNDDDLMNMFIVFRKFLLLCKLLCNIDKNKKDSFIEIVNHAASVDFDITYWLDKMIEFFKNK